MSTVLKPCIDATAEKQYMELLTRIQHYSDTIIRLRTELAAFPLMLTEATKQFEFIDRSLADSLHDTASRLLDYCAANPLAEAVPYVLAAVDYFVCEGDAQPDFSDVDGFEDDAKVINAVIRHFRLEAHLGASPEKRGA